MKLTKRPSWALGALAAGASIAVAIGLATPARAALSGTDWTSVPLSDGVTQGIADGPAVHPVSCVSGTTFCVTIVGDLDNIINGSDIGQAALVTTDAGQTWSTNVTLPSTVFPITALSCATTSVCWASGYSANGGPGVAESTDGGLHWSDRTPSAWASDAHWSPNSIDCVSATTCWMAGSSLFGYTPSVVSTTDGGADWTVFGNLPQFPPDSNGYVLQAISCVTAVSCVAVGGQYGGSSMAAVISTTDGGTTWALSADPALNRVQQLMGLSCLPDGQRGLLRGRRHLCRQTGDGQVGRAHLPHRRRLLAACRGPPRQRLAELGLLRHHAELLGGRRRLGQRADRHRRPRRLLVDGDVGHDERGRLGLLPERQHLLGGHRQRGVGDLGRRRADAG
jgi:photosystem II stability/assembly factor-like uncharacterized protein